MRNTIFVFSIFLAGLTLNAQNYGDSLLINERRIDRPFTLHEGQLQCNTAYEISIISKEYDNNGKSVDLADKGTTSVRHRYCFELNYGILEFIQVSASLNYSKRGERSEAQRIWVTIADVPDFYVSSFYDYKGFEDLFLGAVVKVPLKTKRIELALSPGFYIPLFSNCPKAPENSISLPTASQPVTRILYYDNYLTGDGAKAMKIGAGTIIRPGNDFSVSARMNYSWPVAESETVQWIHQLSGSTFIYDDIPYKYLIGNTFDYEINLAYQAISWFYLYLAWYAESTVSGWSEITGFRVGNPESKLSLMTIGSEIKATSRLWINQTASIALSGKNQLAPFSIYLGISYNFFPFKNKSKQVNTENAIN